MKNRAEERKKRQRKGNTEWKPSLEEEILIRKQSISDASQGMTSKFMHLYEGPYKISKILKHNAYEVQAEDGKIRGEFSKKQMKKYIRQIEDERLDNKVN